MQIRPNNELINVLGPIVNLTRLLIVVDLFIYLSLIHYVKSLSVALSFLWLQGEHANLIQVLREALLLLLLDYSQSGTSAQVY